MSTESDVLHTLIEHLCNVAEEIVRNLAPKDTTTFRRRMFVIGCMARGISCLRSISLLCRNGYLTEPHMVLRNLVETHATLVDIMRKDKFHEYEYRSRYEVRKAFRKQENALQLALSRADNSAEKDRLEKALHDVQDLVTLWDSSFRGFGKSMIKTGRWKKEPKMSKVYKVPSVEEIFEDSPTAYTFLYDFPSAIAVHIKSATVWNDLVPIVSRKPWFTEEEVVVLLHNASTELAALVAGGLSFYKNSRNIQELRNEFIGCVNRDLEERVYFRTRNLTPLVGELVRAHLL